MRKFILLLLPVTAFAWPPVDVPRGTKVHHFAAVSHRINEDLVEEVRFLVNLTHPMESDSGVYWAKNPLIGTPYFQPVPHRAPFAVHILRVYQGRPVMGWIAHMKNYMFEYFTNTPNGYRFSLRIQTDDDLPKTLDRDKPQKRAIRNFHIVLENDGRWGFSQRMGLNPFTGGNWVPFEEVLGVRNIFEDIELARPTMLSESAQLRLAGGEETLWTANPAPILTAETCGSRLQLAGLAGIDSSWMFTDK